MIICKNCFYRGLCSGECTEEEKCEYYAPSDLGSVDEKEYRVDLQLRAKAYREIVEEQNT